MPEREAITVNLSDGFALVAAGIRRERAGTLGADLMLQNDRILFADRAVLNSQDGPLNWAMKATGEGRPSAKRMAEAIQELLLPEALAVLQDDQKKPTQAQALIAMVLGGAGDLAGDVAAEAELFHDPGGEAFATIRLDDHRETWPLRSKTFRQWLARRYHQEQGKAPSAQALVDATNVLAGKALFEGPQQTVHVRLAECDGTIFVDLCNPRWEAVAIDAGGYRVVANPPVKFRRTRGMLPLPYPVAGEGFGALRRFVNIGSNEDWRLLVAWLVGSFRPTGPYPILALHGEQGSSKSTLSRVLRSLVDPNAAPIRTMPRDERDLMIAATNGWVLAFDNVSSLRPWLSDAMCRLATGGGFATRELYADVEETILDAQRPMLLNGIAEIATRGDLLDRAILLYLPSIPENQRRPEATFWREFEEVRPAILGAILDAVSTALKHEASTVLPGYPRMADFARWVSAAEPVLPWERGAFLAAYAANRRGANELTLEASPVPSALRALMTERPAWSGTATQLLRALDPLVDDQTRRQKGWPADGRTLSNRLRELAPNLRAAGLLVAFDRAGKGRTRRITIDRADAAATTSASAVTSERDEGPRRADAADARDDATRSYSQQPMVDADNGEEEGEWAG